MAEKHAGTGFALETWYLNARSAKWRSLDEVRKVYPHADGVPVGKRVYTIFNICGNRFRLIVGINYRTQRIFVKHLLTHAEYDKGGWKK